MSSSLQNLTKLKTLLSINRFSSTSVIALLNEFGSLENIFSQNRNTLLKFYQGKHTIVNKILKSFDQLESIAAESRTLVERMHEIGGRIISFVDDEYPPLLKKIYSPPMILYVNGNLIKDDNHSIAIVGTRQPSAYGKRMAEKFSSDLASRNLSIVSGLARGIDSIAHLTAVKAGKRTIAVIGCGLDYIYPPENKRLYEQITLNGAVISEHPPGTEPLAQFFPSRNRIISGLSIGTLVIESGSKGGSLQTARFALEQNREVFAVPGSLESKTCEGTNNLIKQGEAKLIQNAADIFLELNINFDKLELSKKSASDHNLNFFEEKLLSCLEFEPKQIESICMESNLSISDCLVNLLSLEFKGMVIQYPGKTFSLKH